MICSLFAPDFPFPSLKPTFPRSPRRPPLYFPKHILCLHHRNPNIFENPSKPTGIFINTLVESNPGHVLYREAKKREGNGRKREFPLVGSYQMLLLCGLGYWVQGFRCFPWLALNFHMAHYLNLHPSILQLVQNSGNLPMVAKPLYGILSDALYIGGARRVPYVSIGVLLQVLSWGFLALIPVAGEALPALMACVLLSNLGASITEVAKDALVAEFGQTNKICGLQSYTFMALAVGGVLGNFLGGYNLLSSPPRKMFLLFSILLSLQLSISSATREESLGLLQLPEPDVHGKSIMENVRNQMSDLVTAIRDPSIFRPLAWIVASIAMVPLLTGSIFCYQTQCLHLDPSIIGMSRVVSQLVLLSVTVLYDRYWKRVSMKKLIGMVQILYASSFLLDIVLVNQINLKLGISNELFALCFSGLAETIAQFKLLPFSVLFASLSPKGCEGSLISFFASAVCLSSIVGGFFGIGLASLIGIRSGNYSSLPVGILIQFIAALLPLICIHFVPTTSPVVEREKKRIVSRRSRRNRRVGRVVYSDSVYVYRRERESEMQG
ncbi:probable folate-biopterin transporter 9, chloroplastic [Cucurbita moschata]|uniref:Probable folate-biopterin transporter 9, chloroplastic n=1 Tax=Cucurbita moschata TaxID=3662 RepID=A0A6J1EA28_CUCMO|nr:probable folate-biopterin transporter 9, chloroplastic [Cucurbita moschata]